MINMPILYERFEDLELLYLRRINKMIYTIKDSDKVEILGVYMVNKGYAVLLWWIWLKGMEIIALFLLPAVK